jgi:hypothetical protein
MNFTLFQSKKGAGMARVILAMCFILLLAGVDLRQNPVNGGVNAPTPVLAEVHFLANFAGPVRRAEPAAIRTSIPIRIEREVLWIDGIS